MDVNKSNMNSAAKEDERLSAYMRDRRSQLSQAIEDMEKDHHVILEKQSELHKKQQQQQEEAYKVELSRQGEGHQKKIDDLRRSQKEISIEKQALEQEFTKVRDREKSRVEAYKKNQDAVLEKMHERYLAAQEDYEKRSKG